MVFQDRHEAGRALGARLEVYANRKDTLVLALPRGGVPVGLEVANAIGAPLDVLLVRKLGAPRQQELAIGAIASGGVRLLHPTMVRQLGISENELEAITQQETEELQRREQLFRGNRPMPEITGRTVMLVDDGMATGLTMRAAAQALRQKSPEAIVVAVPVAAAAACREAQQEADVVICLHTPPEFFAVGQWYRDFSQVEDSQVRTLLERAHTHTNRPLPHHHA